MAGLPPLIAFAAPSGTGKTTLIEAVIARLAAAGWRVGAIKHNAHHLVLDTPGKDSWRFRRAGAARVVVASAAEMGVFSAVEGDFSLGGMAAAHLADLDVVLCEGYRRAGLPTLLIRRLAAGDPTWEAPGNVVAIVTDAPQPGEPLPQLPLNDPAAVAQFLVERYLSASAPPRSATALVPAGPGSAASLALAASLGLAALLVPEERNVRPDLGLLGVLLTGLAAIDTPDALLLAAPTTAEAASALLAPRKADIVAFDRDPRVALYGPRCLPAIRAALLSGERGLTGWWGQVRAESLLR